LGYDSLPGLTRFVQKPLQVQGGFVVPVNRNVIVPIWLIQWDAKNFPQPWVRREKENDTNLKDRQQQQQWIERDESDTSGSIAAANTGAFLAGARNFAGLKSLLSKSEGWS
jgi:hypothetical protein